MKKFLAVFLVFFFPLTALASVQVVTAKRSFGAISAGERYIPFVGMGTVTTSDTNASIDPIMPIAGTFSKLRVLSEYVPGGSESIIVTLRKNAANTSLTCTVTSAATTCSDTTNSVSVVQGDKLVFAVNVSANNLPIVSATMDFTPTTANETFLSSVTNGGVSGTTLNYCSVLSSRSCTPTSNNSFVVGFPGAGTLDMLVASTTAPSAGKTWDFTIRNNRASTTVTCRVDGAAPNWCVDTTNSVSIAAGDLVDFATMPLGTPTSSIVSEGSRFVPTVAGDFNLSSTAQFSTGTATAYQQIFGVSSFDFTLQASSTMVVNSMTVTAMKVTQLAASGLGKTRTYTLEKNSVATSATCSISGSSATTCSWTGSITVADGDTLDTSNVPAGTPVGTAALISYIANRNAAATTVPGVSAKNKFLGGLFRFSGGFFRFR